MDFNITKLIDILRNKGEGSEEKGQDSRGAQQPVLEGGSPALQQHLTKETQMDFLP